VINQGDFHQFRLSPNFFPSIFRGKFQVFDCGMSF